ncbi:MAG: hypothetical protein WBK55_01445 [Alphaproteobacteria bacterium]
MGSENDHIGWGEMFKETGLIARETTSGIFKKAVRHSRSAQHASQEHVNFNRHVERNSDTSFLGFKRSTNYRETTNFQRARSSFSSMHEEFDEQTFAEMESTQHKGLTQEDPAHGRSLVERLEGVFFPIFDCAFSLRDKVERVFGIAEEPPKKRDGWFPPLPGGRD